MGCKALRIRKSTRLSRHSHLHIDAAAVHEARSGLVVLLLIMFLASSPYVSLLTEYHTTFKERVGLVVLFFRFREVVPMFRGANISSRLPSSIFKKAPWEGYTWCVNLNVSRPL